jgi:flagellar biosynthesis chaperone FliJ
MRRFRFRFESVEKLKQAREREALRLLGEAQRGLERAKEHQAALYRRLTEALKSRESTSEKLASAQSESVSALLQSMGAFISGQKVRIAQAEHAILRERRKVEKALRIYLLAKRQLKVIETLRTGSNCKTE